MHGLNNHQKKEKEEMIDNYEFSHGRSRSRLKEYFLKNASQMIKKRWSQQPLALREILEGSQCDKKGIS